MIRIKEFLRRPLLTLRSSFLLAGLLLLAASCQSTKLGPYSRSDIENNVYFTYFKAQKDKKLLGKISASAYNLFRATYPEYLKDIEQNITRKTLLTELPEGLIHGDVHALQMAWRNGDPFLDDWDTVAQGPLWLDLVRLEMSSRILAKEQGLRAYPEAPCLESYKYTFTTGKKLLSAKALRPGKKDEEITHDFSTHPVWKGAAKNDAPSAELESAIDNWILKNPSLPIKTRFPKRKLISGVGSLTKEKVLMLDTNKQLWELKEVDSDPLENFTSSKDKNKGCSRYDALNKSLTEMKTNSPILGCLSWKNRTFTLLRWDASYWSPDDKDFKNTQELVNHTEWMCSELARFHKTSLNEVETRHWILALRGNQTLAVRLKRLGDTVYKNIEDAFRMVLLEHNP